jgi:DNA-binding transcriptional ArsR family regulator
MSERALVYDEEPLAHRMLVIYEASGLESDFASYLIRSLLSEGRLRYQTVVKSEDGPTAVTIEREGPTGLITTTTAVSLHPENETRLLSVTATDTPDQTRAVFLALAAEDEAKVELERWHALQRWLELADTEVTIPYAKKLAEMVPPAAVRLRRDFGQVLRLIRAHALLHQATRERKQGRIVATVEDYAAVRSLVADLVAQGVQATVRPGVREVVETVAELDEPSRAEVARAVGIDRSAASRRIDQALDAGYLRDEAEGKRRSRLVIGEAMPEDQEILPRPEALSCSRADENGGIKTPPSPVRESEPEGATPEQEAEAERVSKKFNGGITEEEYVERFQARQGAPL